MIVTQSCPTSRFTLWRHGVGNTAKSALPSLVVKESKEYLTASKVWPKGFGEVQLRVRDLPKEKIADSGFSTRANKEVGIWQLRGGQVLLQQRFAYWATGNFSRLYVAEQVVDGVNNFPSSSIAQGYG